MWTLEPGKARFESWLYHLAAVRVGESCLSSLCLNVPSVKWG